MSQTNPLIGRVFSERYRIEGFIGEGGMSRVWRAVDIRTGHHVAIKILKTEFNQDTEFLERFQREAQAASRMDHHNIVTLLDVGMEDDMRFLVFEYITGSTLGDIIRQKGQLPCQTAVDITIRVLSALQHAHDRGIIHRDIKPQNILINNEGLVKVTDFGIARIANVGTLTKDNMVLGSVHYSSPEQASGNKAEPPSDLYSTGIVLYEMLTGRVPFTGDNAAAVALQQVQAAPPPISDFAPQTPPTVAKVVMKALEKKPENRFASAKDMARALTLAMNGRLTPEEIHLSGPEEEDNSPNKKRKKPKPSDKTIRSRIILISVLILLLAGVLFAVCMIDFRQVSVPDLLDMDLQEAQTRLDALGLKWETEESYHASLPAGSIINQSPGPEETVSRGSTVLLSVSKGPSDQDLVPNVQSMSYENALSTLKEKGLTDIVIVKTVSTLPVGTVIDQTPAAGSQITEGLSVELNVSGGSTLIPSLVGLTREEAAPLLSEAGLTEGALSYAEVPSDQLGQIVAQNPSSGSTAILGSAVSLTIGVESQPYTAEIALSISPDSDRDRVMRMVVVKDGNEYVKYQCTIHAGNALNETIPIKCSVSGQLPCRVYLDDTLFMEIALDFN